MNTVILRTAVPILTISGILLGSLGLSAGSGTTGDHYDLAVARFNKTAPPAYRAFRRLEAGNPTTAKHGWLEVWTEHRPGEGMTYKVIDEGGYEYVRNKILRKLLNSEQELVANGKPLRAPLLPRNYTIEDGGTTDAGLTRLLLFPVRKSDGLVRGTALLEPDSGAIIRMEGRLAKSPSFWVRDVDVLWRFARIGDEMVPMELSSSARVRFYGRQPFKMTYRYESIDGRRIDGATLQASLRDDH